MLPTLQERAYIEGCLESLEAQDDERIREILVVDGGSTDGTRDIVEGWGGRVRLVDNPRVTAAAAMNIGIEAAQGPVIMRADAHTTYATDYCRRSVDTLLATGAAVVGGPMRPVGDTPFGEAVSAVTTSPLGIGPGRFHYADEPSEVETVYLGTFFKKTVVAAGGYDEHDLQWAAEDQELNYRIRKLGGRIWLDPSIRSTYTPRSTPRALLRQYHNYGLCKASTLKKHRTLPYWRPLVPAAMVAGSVVWAATFLLRGRLKTALVPFVTYALGAGAVGAQLARKRRAGPLHTIAALAICQWAYGVGFLQGVGRIITGRPFSTRPRQGRR